LLDDPDEIGISDALAGWRSPETCQVVPLFAYSDLQSIRRVLSGSHAADISIPVPNFGYGMAPKQAERPSKHLCIIDTMHLACDTTVVGIGEFDAIAGHGSLRNLNWQGECSLPLGRRVLAQPKPTINHPPVFEVESQFCAT
jgi:hypothetical protein